MPVCVLACACARACVRVRARACKCVRGPRTGAPHDEGVEAVEPDHAQQVARPHPPLVDGRPPRRPPRHLDPGVAAQEGQVARRRRRRDARAVRGGAEEEQRRGVGVGDGPGNAN